jgi:hypothetical protein
MRLGCLGCLGSLLSLVAVLALVAGGAWTWTRAWEPPPPLPAVPAVHPKSAGLDRKLAELDRKGKRHTGRPESITFSESEVSAIASRSLADAGLLTAPVALVTTEMQEGRAVVQWQGPVGMLLQGPPLGWAAPMLTGGMMQSPVWITLTGAVQLQPVPAPGRTRYAEVSVERARIGRLPVPGWLLTAMAGPRGASLLRWAVPATVDRLDLGEGRLTIRTR